MNPPLCYHSHMKRFYILLCCLLCMVGGGCSGPQWIDMSQVYPIASTKIYINDLGRDLTSEEKHLYPTYIIFSVFPHTKKEISPSDLLFQVNPNAPYMVGDNGGYITIYPQEETWENSAYTVRVSTPSVNKVSGDSASFSVVKLSTVLDK